MLKRIATITAACLLISAGYCLAEKMQIKLKSGDVVVGEIVERTDEGVKVKGKIATVFYPNDKIDSIQPIYDLREDYAQRVAKLKAGDFDSQLALGKWALEKKLYPEAVKHIEAALKIKSDERARLLLRQAKARLEQASKSGGTGGASTGTSGRTTGGTSVAGPSVKFDMKNMVTDEDIQHIRMAEFQKNDRVRVQLQKNVVGRFLEQVAGTGDFENKGAEAAFRRKPQAWQAKYIIDNTSADDPLRADIVIRSDPASMREFRTTIWRDVASNCAVATCHGSAKGKGGLKLWNVTGRNENVDYTNFLILDSFHTKNGQQIIRRDAPEESLLLQYSLPDKIAKFRHPKEINPAFVSKKVPGYKNMLDWIMSLKRPLHPDYRIANLPPHVMKPVDSLSGLSIPPAKREKKESKEGKSGKGKPSKSKAPF